MKFFYVYLLRSQQDGEWYTGFSKDVILRLDDHNSGKVISTKDRRPFDLIYFEACINLKDAIAREKYLKSGMGKKYLKNRLKHYFKNL